MKKTNHCLFIIAISLILYSLAIPIIKAGGWVYSDKIHHYSFVLPNEWKEIPKLIIDEREKLRIEQFSVEFIDFSSGFQPKDREYFQTPYLLIRDYKIDSPTSSEFLNLFYDDSFQKTVDKEIDNYLGIIKNATVENPYIDKERNIIFIGMETDVEGVGKVKGLMVMFLGKYGITQFNFQSMEYEYSEHLPTFISIVDSFHYEKGYEYSNLPTKQNNSNNIAERVAKGFISGLFLALVAAIILLFRYFLSKYKKPK